jgi:hypothetical protein
MSLLPSAGGPASPTDTTNATDASNGARASEEGVTNAIAPTAIAAAADTSALPSSEEPAATDQRPRTGVLMPTALSLFCIGFTLWLVYAWSGYSSKYSQTTDSWRLNSTKMIEITLVAEDKVNLACASDVVVGGLHCGHRGNQQQYGNTDPANDGQVLQPYNTVANELFLGAGLWMSKSLPKVLPNVRFTVMCNYKVLGAAKSVSLRWAPKGSFDPLKNSVAVGTLSDCVIPE